MPRSLGSALVATAAATVAPGTGHLMLRHRRTGGLILTAFLLVVTLIGTVLATVGTPTLAQNLLSARVLAVVSTGLLLGAAAWVVVIVRTYLIARPRGLDRGRRAVGGVVVAVLSLVVIAPLGYAASLVNAQRTLLDQVFRGGGGTSAAEAISRPRLNILLVGSDAGPDRVGARTDTMMVASLDTTTARTTLFALPRNIGYARFPPGTPMAARFPEGFHDPKGTASSGDYLLNAVYAYGIANPQLAPGPPTGDAGLNLLQQTVGYMLGLDLDYFAEVNMSGFATIIDALGGVTLDVGPTPLPIGGVLPDGRRVPPDGFVPAGVQLLDGNQALWFVRSRRDSDDYSRMGRQRCLLQAVLRQKSAADVLTRFQAIARAATDSVATNIPQEILPALISVATRTDGALESVSFDPNLPDPTRPDRRFDTGHADVEFMRRVVRNVLAAPPIPSAPGGSPAASGAAANSGFVAPPAGTTTTCT